MKTIIINDEKQLEKYKKDNIYIFENNVVFKINIITTNRIEAGGWINAGGWIKAGEWINASYIFSFIFTVECKKLITTKTPFWREYYSEMKPLIKYKNDILNEDNCWHELREICQKDAKEICEWDGWHPLIRCQLEMFFGLKNEHVFQDYQ